MIAAERTATRDEYLSIPQLAAMLKITPQTLRRHIREGQIPAARIGGHWRVRRSDLEALFPIRQ